jgi:hypothetical protein
LGFVLGLGVGNSFAAGTHELVKLNFTSATTATSEAAIDLTDQPVRRQISNPAASALSASYVNGLIAVNPLPALGIGRSDQNVLLSWPLWGSNFVLEANGSLSPSGWTNLSVIASPINGQNVVTQAVGAGAVFYRLKR